MLLLLLPAAAGAEHWPRWRGPGGLAVSAEQDLPLRWGPTENVAWRTAIAGEGSSSPIIWGERVFLSAAEKQGTRRVLHCLNRLDGNLIWSRTLEHAEPETASALTGHAAATPATDGRHVVACFGNAGIVCYDFEGRRLWHRPAGPFESELGLASSPILWRDRVILVCDHDGKAPISFDSHLLCLSLATGKQIWKTDRPGLFRSWSTPIIVPAGERSELIVSAQDELRGYDPASGRQLWRVEGLTGWVAPSPVFGGGLIFTASGKAGPVLAVRPGGEVAWRLPTGGPYVCSPILVGDHLYVLRDEGILTCYEAATGREVYQERLAGKFTASPVAGDGKLYLINEDGVAWVIRSGAKFQVLAKNALGEAALASPAIAAGRLFIRTEKHLWCIGGDR